MNLSKIIKNCDWDEKNIKTFSLKELLRIETCCKAVSGSKNNGGSQLVDVRNEAQRIKDLAVIEAKSITDDAKKNARKIEKDALQKGLAEGTREGMAKAEKQLGSLILGFENMVAEFENIKNDFYVSHQDIVLELALKIAKKVIHQEVKTEHDFIIGVLNSAIKLAVDREKLKIRVNPDDLELCLKKRPDFIRDVDGIKKIIFESDECIQRGGAIVEYAFGEIDARIEKQFEEVERGIGSLICQSQQ